MLLEILMASKIVNRQTIEHMLAEYVIKYEHQKVTDARLVTKLLLDFLRDPTREVQRERLQLRLSA
jgi:hypothetical protein